MMKPRNPCLWMSCPYLDMKMENALLKKELRQTRRDISDLEYQLKQLMIEKHFSSEEIDHEETRP